MNKRGIIEWSIAGAAAVFILYATNADAHESRGGMKYDTYCCNSTDCQEIKHSNVTTSSQGYVVTLRPGDHTMVTREHVFTIPYDQARQSTDGEYHICLFPKEDNLRCFYAPPMGF